MKLEVGKAWDYKDTHGLYVITSLNKDNVSVSILDRSMRNTITHYNYPYSTVEYAMEKHALEGYYNTQTLQKIMKKFKKGDKVRVLTDRYTDSGPHKGDICTFNMYISDTTKAVTICKLGQDYAWYYKEGDLEAVTESKQETNMKFKVGDKVRVTDRSLFNSRMKVGDEGTVLSLPVLAGQDYVYGFPGIGRQYSTGHDVELVVEDKTIKVGDKVRINTKGKDSYNNTEHNPYDEVGTVVQDNQPGSHKYKVQWSIYTNSYQKNELELVSKAPEQEIIAYELLKDFGAIKAGTKSSNYYKSNGGATFPNTDGMADVVVGKTSLADTTWFKPIYKPTKKVVKISKGREITIENDKLSIGDGVEFCTKDQFLAVYAYATDSRKFNTGRVPYAFEILTFKLGCQEFTKEDLQLINKELLTK